MTRFRTLPFYAIAVTRSLFACMLLAVVSACDGNPVASVSCPVVSSDPQPAFVPVTVTGFRSGTPPAPLNSDTVRGTITMAVSVGTAALPAGGARVELRVADRVLASVPIPPRGGADQVTLTLTADTGAHDAAGALVVPNGPRVLYVDVLAGERAQAGCTPVRIAMVPITFTFANP
jgi:hypothetical protein